ncbi:VWA domain-containing protein [Candidatus Woesearchaeota archaeon]|nr:VWA domain-containing protein [Candidatus Woesearchaeota archaeon]
MKIVFTHPIYLWILLILPLLILAHIFIFKKRAPLALKFSNFATIEKVSGKSFLASTKGIVTRRDLTLLLIRTMTYLFFILAISGMMIEYQGKASTSDFVLAIDSSSSMLADDFSPNRLEAAKEAAILFVDSLDQKTNIGLVSFAGEVYTDLRPTSRAKEVKSRIESISLKKTGGTNIGDALITSSNLFEGNNPKKLILLTDGQSNVGPEPAKTLDYLSKSNVTVYTVGVATKEGGKTEEFISKLDEDTLQMVAGQTGGKYFRAEDNDVLKESFREIASSAVKKSAFPLSWLLLFIGFITLSLEWLLSTTKFRTLP